ncbi:MAG: sigma-70 family RNA polymerase sigma factor [Patescibacteria group bacterium]|nr:sigma-70 family RNA polymerase sigma factor [Patescibacteria group bacterium]
MSDFLEKTDEELVVLTLENQNHFLYLMNRYEGKLLNYVLRISNINKEEAEDLLQEVFIKVYLNLNDFDSKLKFSSWIYRITRNQVISNFRKIHSKFQITNFNEEILENIASDFNIEKDIELIYLRDNIDKILEKMNNRYSEVLALRFLEEKDYKEISDILKKPMGTVATMLSRAKKDFKKELDKQEYVER